jgi:glycosyltransferase involved in cell wall biosynthesis
MVNEVVGLRALGHAVDVLCPSAPEGFAGGLADRCRERGVDPKLLFERRSGYWPLRDRSELRRLHAELREGGYDLVHVHHSRDHLLAWRASRRLPTRLVVGWHRGEPLPRAPWHRLRLSRRGADGLVVLSERIAESALRLGWPRGRVCVAPGSVDTERFQPRPRSEELARELGLDPAGRVLGVVARIQRHRRFDLLLEAFARAAPRAPGLRMLVIGRGTRAAEILDGPLRARGLVGTVIRAGYRGTDYPRVLGLLHALVFLVPGSDGSCRAVLEAMASGVPAIASRRGVLPEIVVEGVSGRVVDEDPEALAEAMIDVWRDPGGWAIRGKAARERALSRYTVQAQAKRLERFYGELAGESWSSTSSR